MTRLESIIVRMLPANSPDLDRYRKMLIEMDHRYQLSDRFLEHYTKRELKPRVHAEIQVLEDFYTQRRSFVGGDPFIACSKPACFCCLLYFRYHPGRFVEPASHRKIYLNWLPPGFDVGCDRENQNYRRDILNSMTRDIRMEALQQIDGKVAPQPWHPDSITGITESLTQEQKKELRVDTTQQISTAKGIFTVHKLQLSGGGEILTIRDFSSPLTEPCDDDPACSADDDSEGGILL
jgi:hypothetical protein